MALRTPRTPRTYENFDLVLEATKSGNFRARVTSSPLGESRTTKFALPFDATTLENLLLKIDPGRSGTRRVSADPTTEAAMELGGRLYDALFSDELRLAWTRAQDVAQTEGHGLRLRLRLTDAPAIAGLPWELLYDKRSNSYLAQSDRTPLVRYLEVMHPPKPLRVHGPLRVLVVISSPTNLEELDVEAEWRHLRTAMAERIDDGRVVLDRLPAPTMGALADWLHEHDVHVLHFIGHGDYDQRLQDGVLMFCDAYGRSVPVNALTLGPIIRDHDPLRLVVLNACRSARVDTADPFSGMAQGLVQQHVTAVVAMQFPISDKAAQTFAAHFYRSLCDGNPVDQSVTWARQSLLIAHSGEWATPVLFLRSADGQVFDHIESAPHVERTTLRVARRPAAADETSDETSVLDLDHLVATAVPLTGLADTDRDADDAMESGPPLTYARRPRRRALWLVPLVTLLAALSVFLWVNLRPVSTEETVGPAPTASEPSIAATTAPPTTTSAPPAPAPAPPPKAPPVTKIQIGAGDYIGLSQADATALLRRKGLTGPVSVKTASSSKVSKGKVTAISPTGWIPVTNAVTLTLSSGPTTSSSTTTTTTTPPTEPTTAPNPPTTSTPGQP